MAHRRKNKQQQKQQKQSTQNTANFRQRNGGGGSASNTAFFLKKETGKRKKYRRRNTMHKVGREGTWLKQGVHPFLPCQKKKKTLLQYLGAPPHFSQSYSTPSHISTHSYSHTSRCVTLPTIPFYTHLPVHFYPATSRTGRRSRKIKKYLQVRQGGT